MALAHDFQIVRFGWLQCDSPEALMEFAEAKNEKELWRLVADKTTEGKISCISNLSAFRVERVVKHKTPKGSRYICFEVNEVNIDSRYPACTLPFFLSSLGKEIDTRSGLFEIEEQSNEGVLARCIEGGKVIVRLSKGEPVSRESSVFANLFETELPSTNVSGPLEKTLLDGCRGIDFRKYTTGK